MPNEPNWLPVEVVIELDRAELAASGERHFVRDIGLLESAVARPRNLFAYGEDDIVVLVVALMAGVARAHAFEQGNKRAAFGAMRLFLRVNGYDTLFDDSVSWADAIIGLIEHRSDEADFAHALRPFVAERQ